MSKENIKSAIKRIQSKQAFQNENDFEVHFSESLKPFYGSVDTQISIPCDTFFNEGYITPDIRCCKDENVTFIELKYVINNIKSRDVTHTGRLDIPAFSYDILKDCAKVEYLYEQKKRMNHM